MTVGELIQLLSKFDPTLEVVTEHYEQSDQEYCIGWDVESEIDSVQQYGDKKKTRVVIS